MKQPNVELVREFLAEETPYEYDFKTLNQCSKNIDDPLERELVFKRRSTKVDDPDACELTMSIMCLLLMSKGHKVEGYEGRSIHLENGEIFDTDTANSFISVYKGSLMTCIPNYNELCDKHNITGSFSQEYENIFAHRDEFTLKNHDDELLEEFEKFAKLNHAIGNFVLGPKGVNAGDTYSKASRYIRTWEKFDRMDLFLQRVADNDMYDSWVKIYEDYFDDFYLESYYENVVRKENGTVDFGKSKLKSLDTDTLTERVKLTNQIIIDRGQKMVADLQQFVESL